MKKIILLILMVVTIPLTCLRAQSEYRVLDTIHIRPVGKLSMWMCDTSPVYHNTPIFFQDPLWCEWRVMMSDSTVILQVKDNGDLWYVPKYFCHCWQCRKKNQLEWWGNINGKK